MDSWEKLKTKEAYEKLLSMVADDDDSSIEIILPKKCKDESRETDYRGHIYAEARKQRQEVQTEGQTTFVMKGIDGFADYFMRVTTLSIAGLGAAAVIYGAGPIVPAIGYSVGLAGLGVYALNELLKIDDERLRNNRIIKNFEKPEENIDLKFIYTDNPYEIRNKILLPYDSLDKVRENHPDAYEELKKLMDGKCALRKYDFVEEFGEKHPEAFKELKTVAREQAPYDYNLHTHRMKW